MGIPKRIGWFAASLILVGIIESHYSSSAHETKVSGEVGSTIHIEPNDNPQAGTSSPAWFALTRRGGELIPLEDCNCTLSIYAQPRQPTDEPIAQPPLKPVSAEGYQNVPGADIIFPTIGAYELILQGESKTPDDFPPFELTFEVTVAVAQTATPPSPTTEPSSIASISPPVASPTVSSPIASVASAPNSPALEASRWLFWMIPLGGLAIGLPLWLRVRKK